MSRGMVSFLAGLGGGYLKAQDKNHDRERQDKLDRQANELHTARMAEIGDAQAARQDERDYKSAMQAALSTGQSSTGYQVTDAAGSAAFTKDSDAAAALQDMAQTTNGGASAAPATRVSTGMQGATQRGTIAGQQVFADPAKAQAFAASMPMTEHAKLQARQAVAEQYAKLDVADDVRAKLEHLAQKGVFQAGSLLDAGNAAGALKVLQDANPELVPAGAQFKQVDVPDMFDRSKTTKGWALVAPGTEGKPERVLVGDFRDAVFGYLTPEKQFDGKRALAKDAYTQIKDERDYRLKERELEEVKIRNAQTRAEMAQMRAAIAAGRNAGPATGPTVWDDKADAYLRDRYTVKDPATGEVRVDGSGLQFGKTLALAVSQANGGDATRGVGYAFEKDNELRAAATDPKGQYDAGRHAQLRKQYLSALTAPPAPPAAPPTGDSAKNSGDKPGKKPSNPASVDKPAPPPAPAYVPPADSPAGKARAAREAASAGAMQQEVQRTRAVTDAAAAAIGSRDPASAQAVQDMPGFGALPAAQKAEIRKIIFGR